MSERDAGTFTAAELEALVGAALIRAGTSAGNAASVARALVAAEIDGQSGHGLGRLASYAAQVRAGKIDGHAVPLVRRVKPAALLVDARHGFAYPALDAAIMELPAVARETGIATAAIAASHHAGALGLAAERLAAAGLMAIMLANTPSAMAAWGGTRPLLGTNPIAFAAPRRGAPPLVVDLALSQVARGKIVAAAAKGEAIPAGWALDASGQPTTDAQAALGGTLLPSGGAKGAALALMVELLAVALTGSHFAWEASSFLDDKGPPPATGQLVIAIDPGMVASTELVLARAEAMLAAVEADRGTRLPGTRRHALRAAALDHGIRVEPRLLTQITALAGAP